MKKYLINYAHITHYNSQKGNSQSGLSNGGFDEVFSYNYSDIDDEFKEKNKHILEQPRGAGFWLWKPYIIKKTLEKIEENDLLFYSDSGILVHSFNSVKDLKNNFSEELIKEFPDIIEVDNEFPLPALYRLGDYSVVPTEYGTILNFYTELLRDNYEYSALKACLKKLSMEAIRAGSYIEVLFPILQDAKYNVETIKKILNFQEHLLITVVTHDKGQVSMGEEQAI